MMVKVCQLSPIFGQRKLRYLAIMFPFVIFFFQACFAISIDNLEGQAGFRMASLRWSYPTHLKSPLTFRVKYCELHPWGMHRCRYQTVDELSARTGRQETSQGEETRDNFIMDIGGLRMSTNYSFQVLPQDLGQKFGARPSQISLQTKGFSAKATKCLADSSEVAVETGPFFGGRISVENDDSTTTTPGCFVKGNPQSPQTTYTLKIRHKDCRSTVVDGSKVTSVITVQENVPILTHSARRFVVVCSVSPDSFTVKAGVTLPRETSVAKSLDFNRIIKIAPRAGNALHGGGDAVDHHIADSTQQRQESHHNSIPTNNFQDVSQYYVPSHLYAEKHPSSEGRGLAVKLHRGTWETFLIFGMICAAIVASLVSVIWFIRSYRSINSAHDETIRRITADDSSDSNSSISYDESSYSSASYTDSHSEVDVELDFEFSEDINRPANTDKNEDVGLNISLQNSSYA